MLLKPKQWEGLTDETKTPNESELLILEGEDDGDSGDENEAETEERDLAEWIREALPEDPDIGPYLEQLRNPEIPRDEEAQTLLEDYEAKEGLVLKNGKIYVPRDDGINLRILGLHHDATARGQKGQQKQ